MKYFNCTEKNLIFSLKNRIFHIQWSVFGAILLMKVRFYDNVEAYKDRRKAKLFCTHCNGEIKNSDTFCGHCGGNVNSENRQQSNESTPESPVEKIPEENPLEKTPEESPSETIPKYDKRIIFGALGVFVVLIGIILFFTLRTTYVEVPDFTGLSEEEAIDLIEESGLTVGDIRREHNERVDEGLVISHSPRSGRQVERGASVDLIVSLGVDPGLANLEKEEYTEEDDFFEADDTPEWDEPDDSIFMFEYSLGDFGIVNRSLENVTLLEFASLENGEGHVYQVPSIIGIEIVCLVENSFFQDTKSQMGFDFTYGAWHVGTLTDFANDTLKTAELRVEMYQSEVWTPIITNREYTASVFALGKNTPSGPEIHIALFEIEDQDLIHLSITLLYPNLTDEGWAILVELSEVFGKDLFALIEPLLEELDVAMPPPPSPETETPSILGNFIDVPEDPEQLQLLNSFIEEFSIIYVEITGSDGMHRIMPSLDIGSVVPLEIFNEITGQSFDLFDNLMDVVPIWEAYQALTPDELAQFRSLLASQ